MIKKLIFYFLTLIIAGKIHGQDSMPNDRWFLKPTIYAGYTFGKLKNGYGYGFGFRCLYDFQKRFLGGPVFLGLDASFLSPLGFESPDNFNNYALQNYLVIAPELEQNYRWMNNGFNVGTGFGLYKGIQDQRENAFGMITNIGWFPIYRGKAITPYITYRNDWAFDKNGTNMQEISIGINF